MNEDVVAMRLLGLEGGKKNSDGGRVVEFPNFSVSQGGAVKAVHGEALLIDLDLDIYGKRHEAKTLTFDTHSHLSISYDREFLAVRSAGKDTLMLDLAGHYDQLKARRSEWHDYRHNMAQNEMILRAGGEYMEVEMVLRQLQSSQFGITSLEGYLLVWER